MKQKIILSALLAISLVTLMNAQNDLRFGWCDLSQIATQLEEGINSQLEHQYDKLQELDTKAILTSGQEQLWTDGRFIFSTFYHPKRKTITAGFNRMMEPTSDMIEPHEMTITGNKIKVSGTPTLQVTVEKLGAYTMLVYRSTQGVPVRAYYSITNEEADNGQWTIFLHYLLAGNYMLNDEENSVFGIRQDFYTGKEYNTDPGIYRYYLHPENNNIYIEYGAGRVNHGDPSSPKYGKMPGGGGAGALMGPMIWMLKPTAEGLEAKVTLDERFVDHSPRLDPNNINVLTKVQCPWQGVDGKWAFTAVMPLTHELLKLFPKDALELMYAEIFARHGATFEVDKLQKYFNAQKWYKKSNSPTELTDIEKFNAQLINEVILTTYISF